MKICGVPSTSVSVLIDDCSTQELQNADDSGVTYVEIVPGSNFAVRVVVDCTQLPKRPTAERLSIYLNIDGRSAGGRLISAARVGTQTFDFLGKEDNERRTLERFKFSKLQTNERSAVGIDAGQLTQLGEIRIRMVWEKFLDGEKLVRSPMFKPAVKDTLPEKCLKGRALSSITNLEKPERLARSPVRYITPDCSHKPIHFATYIFKYRTRSKSNVHVQYTSLANSNIGDLQIEGVLPREPSYSPVQRPEVVSFKREQNASYVKREKRGVSVLDLDDNDDVAITSIAPCSKRRCGAAQVKKEPEVIDLSGDD